MKLLECQLDKMVMCWWLLELEFCAYWSFVLVRGFWTQVQII